MLLGWNINLATQQDDNGSTALHLVASVPHQRDQRAIRLLLLRANPDALYQTDSNGSFPIHVTASVGTTRAISDFLKESLSCVGLRDATGRTFLHVAVGKERMRTVRFACSNRSLSWILNMQDNKGNTAMHLAVQTGRFMMFCALFGNTRVGFNLTNDKGETALDIARRNIPKGESYYFQDSEVKICRALERYGAKGGICRQDYLEEKDIVQRRQDDARKIYKVKEETQTLCIGSALIATVTFGASFAIPGGYRADDHTNGGTATLAGRYAFDAFTLANALAFASSVMAIISLMYSGSPLINLRSRRMHVSMAYSLMLVSLANVAAAFALGAYAMLAPVSHKTAVTVCVLSSLVLVYDNLELAIQNSVLTSTLSEKRDTLRESLDIPVGSISIRGHYSV